MILNKSLVKMILFFVGLFAVTLIARLVILGGAPVTSLLPGAALAGPVSRGIGPLGSSTALPIEGKDYH
ncbi:MAG: hypothetical protein WA843_03180, partial [Candidatus Saccharimonadales bacterium]